GVNSGCLVGRARPTPLTAISTRSLFHVIRWRLRSFARVDGMNVNRSTTYLPTIDTRSVFRSTEPCACLPHRITQTATPPPLPPPPTFPRHPPSTGILTLPTPMCSTPFFPALNCACPPFAAL
ncbi:unnamed protein product, partial [Ectocarpus sp. 13 AM-2016]